MRRWVPLAVVTVVLCASGARAATVSWTGGAGNNNWKTGGNWSSGAEPTSADDVFLLIPANISINQDAFAGTLTLAPGVTLTGNQLLTVTGSVTLSASSGAVTINVNLSAVGLNKSGAGSLTFSTTRTVTIGGVVNVSGGSVTFQGTSTTLSGTVILSGGTLSVQGTTTAGTVLVTAGILDLQKDLGATSLSLSSGAHLQHTFTSPTVLTKVAISGGGSATLSGILDLVFASGVTTITLTSSPFTVVSTTGTIDISALSLGNAPSGYTFGFRKTAAAFVLDVTQEPIQVDGVASTSGTCASALTWQHTIGATANDRYLLVGVSIGLTGGGSPTVTGVTFGGVPLAQLGTTANGTASSRVALYGLLAPARGQANVVVSFSNTSCNVVGGSLSYKGVSQSTPLGTVVTGSGAASPATVTVATTQGDKIISVLSSNAATSASPGQSGAPVRWNILQGTELGAGDTLNVTAPGSTPISWTLTPAASEWAEVAIGVKAAIPTHAAQTVAEVRANGREAAVTVRADPGSDLVGFRVWREADGRRQLLTPGLIAGPALMTRSTLLAGSAPGWTDAHPVPGARYLIESLHLDGKTRWAAVSPGSGPVPVVASALTASAATPIVERAAVRLTAADFPALLSSSLDRSAQWALAAAEAVKITVSSAGVVRVPAESLFAAGVPLGAPVGTLQLFREGRSVPRTVVSANGATLQPGDAVEFYGHGMDTRYSGSAVYWLTSGRGSGRDIQVSASAPVQASTGSFLATAEIRERLTWFGAARNGDAEKFFGPAVFSTAEQRTLSLDGLDVTQPGAVLEVGLQGVTEVPHLVELTVNGLPVGTVSFDGAVPGNARIPLPPGALIPGDNVVGLVAPADGDVSVEQFVRIVFPRTTVRGAGALDFTLLAGTSTRLDGFATASTRVLDVTDPEAPIDVATWDASGVAALTAPGSGNRHLLAYLPGDRIAPDSVVANRPSQLHQGPGADLVIIGPASLLPSVESLIDRRRSEGLQVVAVDIEDIQDEFASGEKSVDAVRAFLSQTVTAWPRAPRWVLLLGSATYDPRDYLGLGGDLVPSAVVQTRQMEAVSDSWFVGFEGGRGLSVGRLPVQTPAEAANVVSKILDRRLASSRSPVLLVSDVRSSSDFPEMTSDLRGELPDAAATVMVRGSEPDGTLHDRIVDAVRAGPALVDYIGHGNDLIWRGELHTLNDVPLLAGSPTSLWVEMTCMTAFFQDPRRHSLAVATLLAPSGGAWGAWGSTGITFPGDHSPLNRALVKALLLEGKTLGEATRDGLDAATDPEVQSTFVLLGDPSARAVATQALEAAPKTGLASGCSSSGPAAGGLAVLALLAAWTLLARRARVDAGR